ncbi:MAG: FAD-dependent oxidoreductase [Firmicutes bacterium]|nr:FAD-dependent oxidoreductase [Bacillota bacterium]
MSQEDRFDILVVGAGYAGSTAALITARSGLKVGLIERGEFLGSKIVMGNLLYSGVLRQIIPDLEENAPLERFIRRRRFCCLNGESAASFEFESQKYNESPHNDLWSVRRDRFDPWLASQVEAAGGKFFNRLTIKELIVENENVVGVRTADGREMFSDIVIVAAGGNSKLVPQTGDHPEYPPDSYILGIAESLTVPPEIIESRFMLKGREGVSINFYGHVIEGNVGSAFLTTGIDSIMIGAVFNARSLKGQVRNAPLRFLMNLKNHPIVQRMIEGGRTRALSTYIIPEIGFDFMRNLYCNGAMIVGDAAGFLNSNTYPIGSVMATLSALFAAETAIEAKRKGDYSKRTLSKYSERIVSSFTMDDMRKFNRNPWFTDHYPEFFGVYPQMAVDLAEDFLSNDATAPRSRQQRVFQRVKKELSVFPFLRELMESRKRFGDYL